MNNNSIDKRFGVNNSNNIIYSVFEIFLKDLINEDIFNSIGSYITKDICFSFKDKIGFIILYNEIYGKIKYIEESTRLLMDFKRKLEYVDKIIKYFDEEEMINLIQLVFSLIKSLIEEYELENIIYITDKLYLKRNNDKMFGVRFVIKEVI